MAREVSCPNCHTLLRLLDGATEGPLTCPRCLAVVAERPPAELARVSAEVSPTPGDTCRRCGEPIRPEWRYCPACNAPQRVSVRRLAARPDLEARGDQSVTVVCLGLLGLFLVVGLVMFFSSHSVATVFADPLQALVGGGLLLLIAFGTVFIIVRSKDDGAKVFGMFFGLLLLGALLVLCAVILSFQQCLRDCRNLGR